MDKDKKQRLNLRLTFLKRGACSNSMFYILNHHFGNSEIEEEMASDLLAGGIALCGHQCGMVWGGALAIGTEAYRRYNDKDIATIAAINTTKKLVDSFCLRTHSANCSDITGTDWTKKLDLSIFMLKTIATGFIFSPCFNLMNRWTPEAIEVVDKGFSEEIALREPPLSCATELLKKMGATDKEALTVAGFAGGIGLSGNGCGALGAVIWYKMLLWCRKNPGKRVSMFNNPEAKRILEIFRSRTNSEMLCRKICGREFGSIEEHSGYICEGGCSKLLDTLANL